MIFRACTSMPVKFSLQSIVWITNARQIIIISLLLLDIDPSIYPVKKITITVKNIGDYS